MKNEKRLIHKRAYNIGLPLVLVVYVILCLITLSVISVLTAKQNLNNELASQKAYQEQCIAENEAEKYIANANEKLKQNPLGEPEYLSYFVSINSKRNLEIGLTKKQDENGYYYEVIKWATHTIEDDSGEMVLKGM